MGLVVGISVMVFTRNPVETTLLRVPGMLYQEVNADTISNLYNIELVNKTFTPMDATFRLVQPGGEISLVGNPLQLAPGDAAKGTLFIKLS